MPITANCPHCGHTVKAPDNAGGKKGKCPRCAGIVPIPDMPDLLDDDDDDFVPPVAVAAPAYGPVINTAPSASDSSYRSAPARNPVPAGVIAMVTGKPANSWGYRSSFGRTTLSLTSQRLLETTRKLIEQRECEILLSSIDSAEIIAKGNPTCLGLAFGTVGLAGAHPALLVVPLIFAILFAVLKHRFLIIRSDSNAVVLGIKGDDRLAREFMQTLLAEAERAKAGE